MKNTKKKKHRSSKKSKVKVDLRLYRNLSEAEDYNKRFAEQGGKCAICGRPPKVRGLHRDHNHKSLKPRGLLCYTCNRFVIGAIEKFKVNPFDVVDYFVKYDIDVLFKPVEILEKNGEKVEGHSL